MQTSEHNDGVLREFQANPWVRRTAGFGSGPSPFKIGRPALVTDASTGCLGFYAPKLFQLYSKSLGRLFQHDKSLQWNFPNSIFPSATINLPPNSTCFDHLDYGNLAAGWCDIISAGNYNPKTGGHLILFNLKLLVEFPPGSHILIPSAILRHGNTSIQAGEERMGFTQDAAGGLFRWVDNGFRRAEDVAIADPALRARLDREAPGRFGRYLDLFSKLDELSADRLHVFKDVK